MNTVFQLPTQPLPCDDTYDVIVAGGGPAGCTAAIAAAREGAKTLLIEATGCLGGAATAGLVPAWCPFSDQQQIIYRGLAQRVFEACKRGMPHVKPDALDWVPIDHELLKRIYDDLVTEAGADVLFLTQLAAVVRDSRGTVTAAIVCNKAGLTAYRARVFVDCTGDADLAARAGAEVMKGDAQGDLQPATHCFVLAPVDEAACAKGPPLFTGHPESPVHRIVASGRYPHIPEAFACVAHKGYGVRGFNAGHVYHVDGTDPRSVSDGLIEGRKIASEFREGLAEFFSEAFARSQVVATGDTLGIRETRRITGDYVLDYKDWLARRSFEDDICRNCYCIDLHLNPEGLKKMQDGRAAELGPIGSAYEPGESHGIPYRCLTPRGLKNVLVAGRPISCDRLVHGSVRVMPVCLCTGEAAGMAAAHAAQSASPDVHAVDTVRLRQRLREEGAYLP